MHSSRCIIYARYHVEPFPLFLGDLQRDSFENPAGEVSLQRKEGVSFFSISVRVKKDFSFHLF